jgi:acyl-CoA hydrolase
MAQDFITPRQAALIGQAAGRILLGGATADPVAVIHAVAAEPDLWQGKTLTGAFIPGVNERDYAAVGHDTTVEAIFATAGLRGDGRVKHLPLHYSAFWDRLGRPGVVDLVYMTVPPPADDGTIGYGLTCDFIPAALVAGARVVGIINPNMPDLPHGLRIPRDRFAALTEDDAALPELGSGAADAESVAIADHVISLLRPGDTLQMGLGKLPGVILSRLAATGLRDLAYHGGMVTQGIVDAAALFTRGIASGTALGDAAFYARVAGVPGLRLAPVGVTHAPDVLAGIPALVAINSVLEIDLTGQMNAEVLSGRQISGQGGLVDFVRGARASAGGQSIVILPATAAGGTKSRILRQLAAGTPVSVARGDADIVVTEFGVAHLREASLAERAERLTAIAAPQFRDSLGRGPA